MLNQRRAHILGLLIRDYIENPTPIGSSWLVKKHKMRISSATVRNDFSVLETNGFIKQPYTSAGRVPTVRGYQYFVQYLLHEGQIKYIKKLKEIRQRDRKQLAQQIADVSGQSTALVESDGSYHISGLSKLFNKPEFSNELTRESIGYMFDKFEEMANTLFNRMSDEIQCFIGESDYTSNQCALMGVKIEPKNTAPFLILVCGPTRMNYELNRALLKHIKKLYD